jgi:hypothetical protein
MSHQYHYHLVCSTNVSLAGNPSRTQKEGIGDGCLVMINQHTALHILPQKAELLPGLKHPLTTGD